MTVESCLQAQERIKNLFHSCKTREEHYLKIIELGRGLSMLPKEECKEKDRVMGCQSLLYLQTVEEKGILLFHLYSDALISAGLGALLLSIYQHQTPKVVLSCPPKVLSEIGLGTSLSPGRINGVTSLYGKMRKDAIGWEKRALEKST